ncbi:MAG: hypothetical protein SF053_12665 [Bacteroidia bacterium]|nr:hypothetical protein [Bacteroidia bacterium]
MQSAPVFRMLYNRLLSPAARETCERLILIIAIVSYLVHLGLVGLVHLGYLPSLAADALLKNPIAAIYTPFSFILVYEVYLLVYYLPRSITTYVSKQYEIITLIMIRRIFKDLANLELTSDWFQIKYDLIFTYDIVASLLLFYILYLFYAQSQQSRRDSLDESVLPGNLIRFISFKKAVALSLVPVLLLLAIYTFVNWTIGTLDTGNQASISFKNINNVFFDEFFTILIMVDVILLLVSFFHTDEFHKVIRNSGFMISTILIRLSFSVEGLINTVMIVSATLFGLLILVIHNQYENIHGPGPKPE